MDRLQLENHLGLLNGYMTHEDSGNNDHDGAEMSIDPLPAWRALQNTAPKLRGIEGL